MKSWIVIRSRSEGLHCWPSAPEQVLFLRNPHRHEFHTTVKIEVGHDDRELEFFMVKKEIEPLLPYGDMGSKSCEQMAQEIIVALGMIYGRRNYSVEVSEDGENSALVENFL